MNADEKVVAILEQVHEKLRWLVSLTAASHVAGLSQKEAVEKLGAFGMSAKAISEITGYPETSVAPALSRAKKADKAKGRER